MYSEIEDWKNGWYGVRLSASPEEITHLISLLQGLLQDPDQHFHLSSDYKSAAGLGDIEISIKQPDEPDNLVASGLAMAPGEAITPNPR